MCQEILTSLFSAQIKFSLNNKETTRNLIFENNLDINSNLGLFAVLMQKYRQHGWVHGAFCSKMAKDSLTKAVLNAQKHRLVAE